VRAVGEEERGRRERKRATSDAEEIAEIMTAIGETVPKLVRDIIGAVISEETGRNLGRAIGSFYKELRDAGISPEEALKMTKEYMASLMKVGELLPRLLRHPRIPVPGLPEEAGEEAEEAGEEAEGEEDDELA